MALCCWACVEAVPVWRKRVGDGATLRITELLRKQDDGEWIASMARSWLSTNGDGAGIPDSTAGEAAWEESAGRPVATPSNSAGGTGGLAATLGEAERGRNLCRCGAPSCCCIDSCSSERRRACVALSSRKSRSSASVTATCASRSVICCNTCWRKATVTAELARVPASCDTSSSHGGALPASAPSGDWCMLDVTSRTVRNRRSSANSLSSSAMRRSLSATRSCNPFTVSAMRSSERR
mmetsp:Transcript_92122/g.256654  ORF Transcript_92122/g.256654 Transcript_92122/m.256654 type:complete len:238 (-) Transcript_92122:130-843(-)